MSLNQQIQAYLTLIRPPYIFALGLLCVLFIITFQKSLIDLQLTSLAFTAVAFVIAGGVAINDYYDRDSDALAHPKRPIPSHKILPAHAALLAVLTFLAGLTVSLIINAVAFGIVALNIALFILYARVIKRLSGLLSNFVMGYLGATIALFSGAAVFAAINAASLSFVGLIGGGAIGLNVLKDVMTLEGDKKVGYPTVAATRGLHVASIVGALFLLVSAVTSPLPFFFGVVSVAYLFPITVWGGVVVVLSMALLKASNTEKMLKYLRMFTTYWPYIVGLAGISYIVPFFVWGP
ncbi:MAG TPA: UbiA family prenyltransferase [Candidatus Acidoferrales bacterium]|nr:UbiA family prenyltransferase [Candidatus Acidoferrales bacterium]